VAKIGWHDLDAETRAKIRSNARRRARRTLAHIVRTSREPGQGVDPALFRHLLLKKFGERYVDIEFLAECNERLQANDANR